MTATLTIFLVPSPAAAEAAAEPVEEVAVLLPEEDPPQAVIAPTAAMAPQMDKKLRREIFFMLVPSFANIPLCGVFYDSSLFWRTLFECSTWLRLSFLTSYVLRRTYYLILSLFCQHQSI